MTTVNVAQLTTAIHHTGRGMRLPAGSYEVAHLDGVDETKELFVHGPNNGALVCVNPSDPNITITEESGQ